MGQDASEFDIGQNFRWLPVGTEQSDVAFVIFLNTRRERQSLGKLSCLSGEASLQFGKAPRTFSESSLGNGSPEGIHRATEDRSAVSPFLRYRPRGSVKPFVALGKESRPEDQYPDDLLSKDQKPGQERLLRRQIK